MKKYLTVLLVFTLVVVLFAGCAQNTSGTGDPSHESEKKISSEEIVLEEINESEDVPETFNQQINAVSKQRGFMIVKLGEHQFMLLVSLGEKPTAGYDLDSKDVVRDDKGILVTIEEIEPDADTMVAEVITYPYKVFWLKGEIEDINQVHVQNQHGESFNRILTGADAEQLPYQKGTYIGQIDPHSIEIESDGQVKGYQILEVKEKFESLELNEGDKIEFSFEENENGQLILKDIKKK